MAVADAGATGHFVLPGTPVTNMQGELSHGPERTVETTTSVGKMTVRGNENGRE